MLRHERSRAATASSNSARKPSMLLWSSAETSKVTTTGPTYDRPVDDPTVTVLVLLGLAASAAGFVDAVVGGGGLIQLPALLLGLPHASPLQILATNKLGSICGTTVSSAT